ncbi:MAG: ATP-binding cassette domain-containing protein [Firmicutes bacterium]|nr:ATP-binding cassette domain-containing protein [Bacillota bacterium]
MKELVRLVDARAQYAANSGIDHLTYTVFDDGVEMLIGLHNSGKTTLIKVLTGECPLSAGLLYINGQKRTSYSKEEAFREGVFSLDVRSVRMIPNLSVKENLELYYAPQRKRSFTIDNEAIRERALELFREYDLQIDPDQAARDLSYIDTVILSILQFVYLKARLILFDYTGFNLSYSEYEKLNQVIRKVQQHGVTFLVLTDSYDQNVPWKVRSCVIRKGKIIREFAAGEADYREITRLLVTADDQHHGEPDPRLRGILELENYEQEIRDYIAALPYRDELQLSEKTHYLSREDLKTFCDNLSIGDNIALVRYPRISEHGYIEENILNYLEERFADLLERCGSRKKERLSELSHADRRILGIERWAAAGYESLVIQDPALGLDANGRRILQHYLLDLAGRGVRCLLVFYSSGELSQICSRLYVCRRGTLLTKTRGEDGRSYYPK